MKKILVLVSLFVFATSSFAADPLPTPTPTKFVEPALPDVKFLVSGVETGDVEQGKGIPAGDNVIVTLKLPENLVAPIPDEFAKKGKVNSSFSSKWEVRELMVSDGKAKQVNRKFRVDGDKSVSFGTGIRSTELQVECIVTWLFVVQEDTTQKFVVAKTVTGKYTTTVTILGQMPQPPNPDKPDPNTPLSDGKLGVNKKIAEAVNKVPSQFKNDVVAVYKNGTVKTLNEANAGKLSNGQSIMKAWGENNIAESNFLSVEALSAVDSLSNDLKPIFKNLYDNGKLTTSENYKNLLTDMLEVLEKVK